VAAAAAALARAALELLEPERHGLDVDYAALEGG
jgi:hypothetical protein